MEEFDVAVVGAGALGSAAAHHLALRGATVVLFEQFEFGHVRGASHDTSRILRTSYGDEAYVRLAKSAYRDWAELERVSGERLVTTTGGVVFVPPGSPYPVSTFAAALAAQDLPFELMDRDAVAARWPQFTLPPGVETVFSPDTGIVPAARTVATLQMQARSHGAVLRDRTRVEELRPQPDGVVVMTTAGTVRARKVVVAADAWTNALIAPLGVEVPLVTMQEQVTYFGPDRPEDFGDDRLPVWIWEDEPCYYGFPTYGEPTVKAGRDASDNRMTPEERTFRHSEELLDQLRAFMRGFLPASGADVRTITCQYTLTPGRRFVVDALPEHPDVLVALGAAHAFKFTPTIGRILAELALDGRTDDDISAFRLRDVMAPVPIA
ncbi:N-methyl-L-tryptophan oxidase [Curtobacterium sp. MCBD17_003]|uniref:N-methyl-L-tryptophan oxidase n=1 Tax=Curtobacterium sp. MCBD17_003 TaxID=2175667 RepID=UPI000DA7D5BD|nr:N-methyl-L-tryptophan oxidase [Curtobacterium sp. MCBD17_003]WIE55619.1 N-methyl-L-tryptophan oxidase [Curtobacterium sp. MCBD17_003]